MDDLTAKISELKKIESEMASKESKLEEEIKTHKASKRFLDLIAIASKNKKPVNQKKRQKQKLLQQATMNIGEEVKQRESSTFLTQLSRLQTLKKQSSLKMHKVGKSSYIKSSAAGSDDDDRNNNSSQLTGIN